MFFHTHCNVFFFTLSYGRELETSVSTTEAYMHKWEIPPPQKSNYMQQFNFDPEHISVNNGNLLASGEPSLHQVFVELQQCLLNKHDSSSE